MIVGYGIWLDTPLFVSMSKMAILFEPQGKTGYDLPIITHQAKTSTIMLKQNDYFHLSYSIRKSFMNRRGHHLAELLRRYGKVAKA
jgi:hypothetical protein